MNILQRVRLKCLAVGLLSVAWLPAMATTTPYEFQGGYPTPATVQRVYDDIDMNRAVQAYRFFYPNVSMFSTWKGSRAMGMQPNRTFSILEATPRKQVLTANADTPYASMLIDVTAGPVVVELPPGPLISIVDDLNQRWVMDLGLPGPDKGQGGKHLILPPGYQGEIPPGYAVGRATTNNVILILRVLPKGGDTQGAEALMKGVKVHALDPQSTWPEPEWINQSDKTIASELLKVEGNLQYWQSLHELIDQEPAFAEYRGQYGDLAALGIVKGKPFAPDARLRRILEQAAQRGNAQLRVESLADRSADRIVWPDRQWEWAVLRPTDGSFSKPDYVDMEARNKWFFQALGDSPAMFRRAPGAGSLYWLGSRDDQGAFLEGGKSYRLTIPQSVPARLFWSLTVYDAQTRSQIATEQMRAAIRSLYDLKQGGPAQPLELYFGPKPPVGKDKYWIKTKAGQGWFTYFRIYGPEAQAFDGSWRPGDFEEIR